LLQKKRLVADGVAAGQRGQQLVHSLKHSFGLL
jgi:hypothetical protein